MNRRMGITLAALLGALSANAVGGTARAHAASNVRVYVTPAMLAPAAHVHAVIHVRGLTPGSAVELQIDPPAPAMETLVDARAHANGTGAVDMPVSFSGTGRGAYIVFVNLGRYVDQASPVKGESIQTLLPVDTPGAHLALPCGAPLAGKVACEPLGYGFVPHEPVSLSYRIVTGVAHGADKTRMLRRTVRADDAGMFIRPALSFTVDPSVLSYHVTFSARGTRGDHAEIEGVGMA